MNDFTFLEEEQIFGTKVLDIIQKRGAAAAITDFAILLGGYVSNDYHYNGGTSLEDRTGWYWTKTDDGDDDARVVHVNGYGNYYTVNDRNGCGRSALTFSDLSTISTNGVSGRAKDGILEIEYGYYPQKAVSKDMQRVLEMAFQAGILNTTGNTYTTDSRKYNEYDSAFLKQEHIEYEYMVKRYVRVKANSYYGGNKFTLSNGEAYHDGDFVWIEVQPVKWLVDEKYKVMIAEKLIFAGVQFNKTRNYKTRKFDTTDIKTFMNNHLSKDLFQCNEFIASNQQESNITTSYRKENPYNFDFNEVSEEEIIKGAIESGVTVFLHGRSSEGGERVPG